MRSALERVVVTLGRLVGRLHGRPRADDALYWLSHAVGALRRDDAIGCARIGRLRLLVPLDDAGLRFSYVAGRYEPDVERWAAAILRRRHRDPRRSEHRLARLALRRSRGAAGRVVAFEPGPRQRGLLERSVRLSGLDDRVLVRREAVADEQGSTMLYEDRAAGLTSSIHAHGWLDTDSPLSVEVTSLDARACGPRAPT